MFPTRHLAHRALLIPIVASLSALACSDAAEGPATGALGADADAGGEPGDAAAGPDATTDATPDPGPEEVAPELPPVDAGPDDGGPGADVDTGPSLIGPWAPPPISWTPCALETGGATLDAECTTVPVPARWDNPDGPTLGVFLKRLPASSGESQAAIWMLQGGPGGSGVGMEQIAKVFHDAGPTLDVIIPDHRGTGRSSRLGCPETGEAYDSERGTFVTAEEWPDCLDELVATHGDLLDAYNTTWAAADVGMLIDALTPAGEGAFFNYVYGVSYGTYWGHRYLQLFGDQATAVILDSVCSPSECRLNTYDQRFDDLGLELLAFCADDPACADRFADGDPAAAARAVTLSMDEGHCPDLEWDRERVGAIASFMLRGFELRQLLPAFFYRLERCSEDDVQALSNLEQLVAQPTGGQIDLLRGTPAILYHIALSELWDQPSPSVEAIEAELADAIFRPVQRQRRGALSRAPVAPLRPGADRGGARAAVYASPGAQRDPGSADTPCRQPAAGREHRARQRRRGRRALRGPRRDRAVADRRGALRAALDVRVDERSRRAPRSDLRRPGAGAGLLRRRRRHRGARVRLERRLGRGPLPAHEPASAAALSRADLPLSAAPG